MDKLANNLKLLLKINDMTASELSKEAGVDRARISRILSEKITNPQLDTLLKIAECCNVSVDQLIGKQPIEANIQAGKIIKTEQIVVPVISWEASLIWKSIKENYSPTQTIFANTDISENSYALTIPNDKFEPKFSEGAIIIIDPDAYVSDRNFILAKINDHRMPNIYQVIHQDNNTFLKTVDLGCDLIEVDMSNVDILGLITEAHFKTKL